MAFDPVKDAMSGVPPDPTQQQGIVGSTMAAPPLPAITTAPEGIVGRAQQLEKPAAWQMTDDQTVEGRINRIISAGSPLMQQAKTRSLEAANARGLANTSMAVTAGESSLYDAALPIAQADAATASKAAGYNADQSNQFAVRNVDAQNQFGLQAVEGTVQRELADKQAQSARDLALINRETQTQLANLDSASRAQADSIAAQNQRVLETSSQANSAYQQAVSAASAIQNNPQMEAATKTQAVAQVWRDLQVQMRVLQSVSGLDLTSQLTFANYPGFDGSGNYIGFDSAGNTNPSATMDQAIAQVAAGWGVPADQVMSNPTTAAAVYALVQSTTAAAPPPVAAPLVGVIEQTDWNGPG